MERETMMCYCRRKGPVPARVLLPALWLACMVVLAAAALLPAPARAQTPPPYCDIRSNFISLTVDGIMSTTPNKANLTGNSLFTVTCSNLTTSAATITVQPTNPVSGTVGELKSGSNVLHYQLCQNSPYDNCTTTAFTAPGFATLQNITLAPDYEFSFIPVIPVGETAILGGAYQGAYQDRLTVTVSSDDGVWTQQILLTATAASVCHFGSTEGTATPTYKLHFPLASGTTTALTDAYTTIEVTCSAGVTYDVTADDGLHPVSGSRQMKKVDAPGTYLNYQLYQDAGRTTVWGGWPNSIVGGTAISKPSVAGTTETIQIFGRVPAGQALTAGSYRDIVTLEVRVP